MEQGAGFGELALIYNDKRSASIQALEDCETYTLDGVLFKSIIIKSSMQKRSEIAGFLNSIKLFDKLDQERKLKLSDGLQTLKFDKDQFIFKEGDTGEEFFIIEQGEVDCLKSLEDGQFKHVRTLSKGDHFGELALINNDARSLNIKSKSEVRLLMLNRDAFTRILGNIEYNLKKDYSV